MASCGNVPFFRYLIDHGARVNARDSSGKTPLHRAAQSCRTSVVFEMLLRAGAQVNAQDNNGWTPLHVAAAHNMVEAVLFLLQAGAQRDAHDNQGMTPFDVAVQEAREVLCEVSKKEQERA
jgi:ankyrin repeat protein